MGISTSGRECIEFPNALENKTVYKNFLCFYVNIPFLLVLPHNHHSIKYSSHNKTWSTLVIWGKVRCGSLDGSNGKRMDLVENLHEKRLLEMIPPKFRLEPPESFSLHCFPDG